MKLGLVGPAEGNGKKLREVAERLLRDHGVDQVVYLGDGHTADAVVAAWAAEILPGGEAEETFLTRGAELALAGTPSQIEALLAADTAIRELGRLRKVPPPPARAIEMLDDRIVLLVHDKAILDEEDIANAFFVAYGRSDEASLKRFGPRYFFTPGPLSSGKVGLLAAEGEGVVVLSILTSEGAVLSREVLDAAPVARMTVSK